MSRAVLAAALLAAVPLAGCGGGGGSADAAGDQAPVRATVQRYLTAIADARPVAACAQLTEASRERVAEFAKPLHQEGEGCPATMRAVFGSAYGKRLAALRHARITRLKLTGATAVANVDGIDQPLALRRGAGGAWRIEFTPSVEADKLPGGPPDADGGKDDGGGESDGG